MGRKGGTANALVQILKPFTASGLSSHAHHAVFMSQFAGLNPAWSTQIVRLLALTAALLFFVCIVSTMTTLLAAEAVGRT
jgi:hypothetical protein